MERCRICNGRTMKTADGARCMNNQCEGSNATNPLTEGYLCKECGESMAYGGEDLWGQPRFTCPGCGAKSKL